MTQELQKKPLTALEKKLNSLPITFTFTHMYFDDSPEWPHDKWRVTISYNNNRTYTTEYRTGIGHRAPKFGTKKVRTEMSGVGYYWDTPHGTMRDMEAIKNGYLHPSKIDLADVMACLLSDASSGKETFMDWCSSLGYDTDSRKALDTYLVCQSTLMELQKVFGSALFDELASAEH